MRLLTKAEACRELGLSLSTLDRRIASGELRARREPHGKRHRVYVVLDDDPLGNNDVNPGGTALAVAQERIGWLEAQLALLREHLEQERQRNAELINGLRAALERRGPWWRFWQRGGDRRSLTGQAGRGMMNSKTNKYNSNQ